MGPEKNYNIEIVRLFSFIFVIMIHVSNYFCRGFDQLTETSYIFSVTLNAIARISVPCFFMISGALLLDRKESIRKSLNRVWKYSVILLVWGGIYYLFEHFYMGEHYNLANILFEPVESHLWYLYAMIPIYLILPFAQILVHAMSERQEHYLMLLCILVSSFSYLASFLHQALYYDLPIIGDQVYMVAFFLGYYIKKHVIIHPISSKNCFIVCALCIVLNIACTVIESNNIGDHYERFFEYRNTITLLASASFFCGVLLLKDKRIELKGKLKKCVDTVCSCSLGIYLIHIIFLDFYKKYMGGVRLLPEIQIPVLTVALFAISFVSVYLIRKIPFGKKIVG